MADNPEPDGQRQPNQSAYPGLHWHFMCEKLSLGTYVWRIVPHSSMDQTQDQSDGLYWDNAGESMASRM
jgi:hypothetical protein